MIALVFLLAVGSYLSFSLFSSWQADHPGWFYGSVTALGILLLAQAWLFYIFFRSSAEEKLVFEKPLQRFAYTSMGIVSFLFTFTAIRDLAAAPLRFFKLEDSLYGTGISGTIVALSFAGFVIGMMNARFRISTPLVPIPVENLPAPLEGLRIVQLSDVHFGSGPDLPQVKRLIDRALELKPDLVVLTGDIHSSWAIDLTDAPRDPARFNPETGVGTLGVEFITPAVTSPGFPSVVANAAQRSLATERHIKWANLSQRGYTILDVTPERVQCAWYLFERVDTPRDLNESLAAVFSSRFGEKRLRADAVAMARTDAPALAPFETT